MIQQDLIEVSLRKEEAFYMLALHYDERSFQSRLNILDADTIIHEVASCLKTFSSFSKETLITLGATFAHQLFDECEKYAERVLATREGTNIIEITTLKYEYSLLRDREYVEDLLDELLQ